jgi:hypothetical protein
MANDDATLRIIFEDGGGGGRERDEAIQRLRDQQLNRPVFAGG